MQTAIPNPKIEIPVLKAWKRIFQLLECINAHPYNRDGFQDAILELYGGEKSPKSVFRGMAIPTLRNLGLIVGYGDLIRISANGAVIHIANNENKLEGLRALRTILVEIDEDIGILNYLLEKSTFAINDFLERWINRISITDMRTISNPNAQIRAARERITDWVNFLTFAELLYNDHSNIRIDVRIFDQTKDDLNCHSHEKENNFKNSLLSAYKRVVFEQQGIGTVEIENLRREVALSLYKKYHSILTEKQFDSLLTELPKTTTGYVITFGRSIGADEKLFHYQGRYYQTLFIRSLEP